MNTPVNTPNTPENPPTNDGVLSGYRVLDFGWVLAGAIPGMVLADMGAEVIKVETRQRLDYMRLGRPIVGDQPDPEQNPMFHNVNRGKLSVTLNIAEPDAVELAKRLVARCDVVIENFSPGVMDRLGLGYENAAGNQARHRHGVHIVHRAGRAAARPARLRSVHRRPFRSRQHHGV